MSSDTKTIDVLTRIAVATEKIAASLEVQKRLPAPAKQKLGLSVDNVREELAAWLPDLEVTSGLDGSFTVKPKRYLHQTWAQINEVIRGLSGRWESNGKQGTWRIPK
jgi:hypothetical protein